MNVFLSCIFSLVFVLSTMAQYDGRDPQIASRFRPGIMWFNTGWRPAKEGAPRKYDRLMVDITYNDWVNDSSLFLVKPGSIGCNVSGMWDIPLTKGNTVSIGIGVSYRYQRMSYNGYLQRDSLNQATQWMHYSDTNQLYDKSIFGSQAIAVPLELRFRSHSWRHVKLHLGGFIGYRTSMYTKVWTEDENRTTKDKGFYDDERLFYGVHARLGIRNWAFFGSYTFTELFSAEKSTSLQPIAFGITVSLF